jgi:hypothetical protein
LASRADNPSEEQMMRWMLWGMLVAGCAAPATELKACPSGDCEAEARAAEQKRASDEAAARLRTRGLINRASFDLNCPGPEIVVVKLGTTSRGVRGCGKQATYVHQFDTFDDWALNSPVSAMR